MADNESVTSVLPTVSNEPDPELMEAMETVVAMQGVNELDADDEEAVESPAAVTEAPKEVEKATEAAAEPAKPAVVEERSAYSKKLAEIAKLEWEATQEKRALKEAQAAAKAELERAKTSNVRYDRLQEVAKTDKFAALKHLGIDPRDLINEILQKGGIPAATVDLDKEIAPKQSVQAQPAQEIVELKNMVLELKQRLELEQGQKAIETFRGEVNRTVSELLKDDNYSSLAALPVDSPADTIFDVIREHAEKTGALLTVQQAADMVKSAWEEDLARYKSNPKFLELIGSVLNDSPQDKPVTKSAKTLGNKTQTAAKRPANKDKSAYEEPDIIELANQLNINWGA